MVERLAKILYLVIDSLLIATDDGLNDVFNVSQWDALRAFREATPR